MPPAPTLELFVMNMHTGASARYALDRLPVTIGRDATNRLRLDDPAVSRTHATLEWTGESVVLTDLGSKNGTHHQGFAVPACVPQPLDSVFIVAIGPFILHGVVTWIEPSVDDTASRRGGGAEPHRLRPDDTAATVVRPRLAGPPQRQR
jgi:predicted component of type VI protein secretion system